MEKLILGIWILIFIYLNLKIIISDITQKRVPNKYLLWLIILIPFWYLFLVYFLTIEIHIWSLILNVLIAFVISLSLYIYNIWGAWDAKYILVLYMFIAFSSIIGFIWSICLSIMLYLVWYYIWFWTGKNIISSIKKENTYKEILFSQKDKILKKYKILKFKKFFTSILYNTILFLTLFIIFRLTRLYLFEYIYETYQINMFDIFLEILKSAYWVYFIIFILGVLGGLFILCRMLLFKIIHTKIGEIFWRHILIIFGIWLWIFTLYEFIKNPEDITKKLILILTLYLWIYLWFKILWKSYKLTFQVGEEEYIPLEDLKEWMIIDKKEIIHLIANQKALTPYTRKNQTIKQEILWFSMPINKKNVTRLQNLIKKVNDYHIQNQTVDFEELKYVKIIHDFGLSPYIFLWFFLVLLKIPEKLGELIAHLLSTL